jgi:hypothetical protein
VREIDDLPATVWWGVQVRQSSLHIAQCIARVQESCAALLYTDSPRFRLYAVLFQSISVLPAATAEAAAHAR